MTPTRAFRPDPEEHPLAWARRKAKRQRRTRRWINLGVFFTALFFAILCWGDWSMVVPCVLIALIVVTELP